MSSVAGSHQFPRLRVFRVLRGFEFRGAAWDWEFNQPLRIAEEKRAMGIKPPVHPDEYWKLVEHITGKDLRPLGQRDAEQAIP